MQTLENRRPPNAVQQNPASGPSVARRPTRWPPQCGLVEWDRLSPYRYGRTCGRQGDANAHLCRTVNSVAERLSGRTMAYIVLRDSFLNCDFARPVMRARNTPVASPTIHGARCNVSANGALPLRLHLQRQAYPFLLHHRAHALPANGRQHTRMALWPQGPPGVSLRPCARCGKPAWPSTAMAIGRSPA